MTKLAKTIAVHGFMFDPDGAEHNRPTEFFRDMDRLTAGETVGYGWYSVPFGFKANRPFSSLYQTARAWLGAWRHGHLQPYKYAWSLAQQHGSSLADLIAHETAPVNIVAHSLGTRVVLEALRINGGRGVRRVVFLNGAELSRNAVTIVNGLRPDPGFRILNIGVVTDDVLRYLGSMFSGSGIGACIGNVGLGKHNSACRFWKDAILDSPHLQERARVMRGWRLDGDDPKSFWDHWYTYKNYDNCELVRAFLADDNLDDIIPPSV